MAGPGRVQNWFHQFDLSLALDTEESFPKGRGAFSDGAGVADNNGASIRITFYDLSHRRARDGKRWLFFKGRRNSLTNEAVPVPWHAKCTAVNKPARLSLGVCLRRGGWRWQAVCFLTHMFIWGFAASSSCNNITTNKEQNETTMPSKNAFHWVSPNYPYQHSHLTTSLHRKQSIWGQELGPQWSFQRPESHMTPALT